MSSPLCISKTTVDQRSGKWHSKNTTIFVGTIIYQLHVSALIGYLQVGIQRQRKISIISVGMGGRDLVYKYMGFVVESVLEQACVRLVCTSVGLASPTENGLSRPKHVVGRLLYLQI